MENKDRIIKCLAYDGKVSIVCADTTYLVEQARKIHDLSPVATAVLGRTLTISSIIAINMKNTTDKLTVQIRGDGPIGSIVVVANNFPKLKGFVGNNLLDISLNEDGKLDVGKAVGKNGFLNVIKDIGLKEPYVGIVPLVSGEIAQDFTNYFATSEQTPSVVSLGVLVNSEGVKKSGGYVLTLMPDATEDIIEKIEKSVENIEQVSKMLDENISLIEIAKKVTGDENIKLIEENIIPVYECDCSKENMEKSLMAIGKAELKDIIETQGDIETVCHFCNKKYNFSKQELQNLVDDI